MSDEMRTRLRGLLGNQPGTLQFRNPVVEDNLTCRGISLERIRFEGDHGQMVPGLYVPPGRSDAPAVLYLHAHGGAYDIGAAELTEGRPALAGPWLDDLVQMGAAVLCLEMPLFGRRVGAGESSVSKACMWAGKPLFGQMLAEQLAGFDWLRQQSDIDPDRIGCIGISMGGTLAFWMAALEVRLAAAVSMCAFADLAALIRLGNHDKHGHYMTVPGLLPTVSTGHLAGLAAPMPMFIGVGLQDWSSPPEAFDIARDELDADYAALGASVHYHVEPLEGHVETPAMRAAARSFLARHIGGS